MTTALLEINDFSIVFDSKGSIAVFLGIIKLPSESEISNAESLPRSLEPNFPSSASTTIDLSVPQSSSLTITSCATSTNLLVK